MSESTTAPTDAEPRQHWVVHYAEIGTKGLNRIRFERQLMDNIRKALAEVGVDGRVRRSRGRLMLDTPVTSGPVAATLACIPGIANFAPVVVTSLDLTAIRAEAVRQSRDVDARTFAVRAKRSNKQFPLTSVELGRLVGADIVAATTMTVDLERPEHTVRIELLHDEAVVFTRRVEGFAGLPVGISGTAVALLSGGIDSPVAAFKLIRRGCQVVLLHFHNYTRYQDGVRSKIVEIAQTLARYQLRSRLYIVPFADLQGAIVATVPPPARMVAYRRMMLQIAAIVAEREGALAFVTGDAVGQVASQTLENLRTIHEASTYPILSPLIGDEKQEIIELAKRIGTYEISIRPYADCCTFLVARHPDTKVRLAKLVAQEAKIPLGELTREALDETEVHDVAPLPWPANP